MMHRSLWILVGMAGLVLARQATQQKQAQAPPAQPAQAKPAETKPAGAKPAETKPAEKKPEPLFGGMMNIRSSRRTKESATLGFNGIDPSGRVDKQMLATKVSPADIEKVKKMAEARPAPAEVNTFAKEGKLKTP